MDAYALQDVENLTVYDGDSVMIDDTPKVVYNERAGVIITINNGNEICRKSEGNCTFTASIELAPYGLIRFVRELHGLTARIHVLAGESTTTHIVFLS